ncbi:hypothetical protein Esti_003891 [Eimeria stiedai]
MDAPPTWFDFSTECIYTAQKHKKRKAWRDGMCTCTFVRGWVVLKLFHEGATTNSEPLEEWRIPPDVPAVVANQEIEFQVHLVQLLGCPQPLDASRRPQPQLVASQHQGFPPCRPLQAEASRNSVPPSKRRLPVGLLRPAGVSPCGFRTLGGAPAHRSENERLHASRQEVSAQPHLPDFSAARPQFVPPLRRVEVAPPKSPVPLPQEMAWVVNAARAVLLHTCSCSGCSQCSHCSHLNGIKPELSTVSMFKGLFRTDAGAPRLSRVHQRDRSMLRLHESRGEIAVRAESNDNSEPLGKMQAKDDHEVMLGPYGSTCFQPGPQSAPPVPARQVKAGAQRGGIINCSPINNRLVFNGEVHQGKLCSDREGDCLRVHSASTSRFAAFISGGLAPHL